ncbi:glucose-1-phosphate thymidylyltransferase [Halonotius terrestris]|uniref:Bifunctional protein GlmU n=1 Tax=Halonotius terrestris TaxID=2487750 RepID=A0A8J8P7L5_9EURY|nr:sugar phosphate nucleotidyltransferase [Halonotius terrestris]TQQ79313.1 glucose-1-phosphate thymidylyltransferase [Halonotius terrestris]
MQVVILAAGRGTRMGPLTESMPKPLLPVADRPLVAHVADAAVAAGADELVLTVGYGGDQIREYFGTAYGGVPVRYAEQTEQRGTADALAAAADHLDDDFAVLNGDSIYEASDLAGLFESVPQVGAVRVDNPSSYGVLATDDDGVVTEVREKPENPESNLVNAGAYTFPKDAIELLDVPESERGEYELTDVLERLIDRDALGTVVFETWLDVGRPWELLAANERRLPGGPAATTTTDGGAVMGEDWDASTVDNADAESAPDRDPHAADGVLANHLTVPADTQIHPDATIRGDVVIEAGVSVGPGVVIEGPTLLRAGSSVGPNAYIRGATLLGEDAHVGHAVEIKNSVLMAGATVGHLSYVGDSILARDVNLGAGTNVANLRHDDEPVALTVKGDRVSTGRRKFGTVLGPDVATGIQTGINPGVTLSAGTRTEPGENVTRDR